MMKPRHFSHKPIFVDEHQERLAQVEQRVRRDASAPRPAMQKGVFASSRSQRESVAFRLNVPMLLSMVLILLAVLLLIAFTR